jgi:hypothetical protein
MQVPHAVSNSYTFFEGLRTSFFGVISCEKLIKKQKEAKMNRITFFIRCNIKKR